MRFLITGAGQIGSTLAHTLTQAGHEAIVVRRSDAQVPIATTTISGDAADTELLSRAAAGANAIFHCIHAPYDAKAWRRELPHRERAVLDVAASLGVPVVFPESVYAFGAAACDLEEGAPLAPVSPLGEVRAELLRARAEHEAVSISVVASDLFGAGAGDGSVATVSALRPAVAGKRAWVLADKDAPHSWTYLPDMAEAMVHCALNAATLAPNSDVILHAPTAEPVTLRELAKQAAALADTSPARVSEVPVWVLGAMGPLHPAMRELHAQRYLWRKPAVLRPGRLTREFELHPTDWATALDASVRDICG